MPRRLPFRWTIPLSLIGGFALLLILHRTRLLVPIESVGARIAVPLAQGIQHASNGVRSGWEQLTGRHSLQQENETLRANIQELLLERANFRRDQNALVLAQQAQALIGERGWQGVSAQVIGRVPDATLRVYLINRGTRQGVQANAAVIVGEGVYAGRVLEADTDTAKVLLVTDPQASVAAYIANDTNTQGVLAGEFGLALRLSLLAKSDPIATGQLVLTSGLDSGIPRDLLLGRVSAVENKAGDLFQSATVTPAIDVRTLTVVTVLALPNA